MTRKPRKSRQLSQGPEREIEGPDGIRLSHLAVEQLCANIADFLAEMEESAAPVHATAARLAPVIDAMKGARPDWLPGYRARILDGNESSDAEATPPVFFYPY